MVSLPLAIVPGPLTVLFLSVVFIVVGAAAAVIRLVRALRRPSTDVHPDDPKP